MMRLAQMIRRLKKAMREEKPKNQCDGPVKAGQAGPKTNRGDKYEYSRRSPYKAPKRGEEMQQTEGQKSILIRMSP